MVTALWLLGFNRRKKVLFLLEALEIKQNCHLTYQQIKPGTSHFDLANLKIQILNNKDFKLCMKAKKQRQKIECF